MDTPDFENWNNPSKEHRTLKPAPVVKSESSIRRPKIDNSVRRTQEEKELDAASKAALAEKRENAHQARMAAVSKRSWVEALVSSELRDAVATVMETLGPVQEMQMTILPSGDIQLDVRVILNPDLTDQAEFKSIKFKQLNGPQPKQEKFRFVTDEASGLSYIEEVGPKGEWVTLADSSVLPEGWERAIKKVLEY